MLSFFWFILADMCITREVGKVTVSSKCNFSVSVRYNNMRTTERQEQLIKKREDKKRKQERNDRRRSRCAEALIALQVNSILGYVAML